MLDGTALKRAAVGGLFLLPIIGLDLVGNVLLVVSGEVLRFIRRKHIRASITEITKMNRIIKMFS